MLRALTLFLLLQLAGEMLVRLLGWPIPGPVLGMALLFAGLSLRGSVDVATQQAAGSLLRLLPLFFVPAGVGVIEHLARLRAEWPAILAALVLSTLLALAVTALVLAALLRRTRT